jgi:ATP-GRASP peptide maturase of grasp-with-spasm system
MILLFSELNDFSTNKVIDWLIYWKKKHIRHNGVSENDSEIDFRKYVYTIRIENEFNEMNISKGNRCFSNGIKSIWFRRPYNGVEDFYYPLFKKKSIIPIAIINKQLKSHFTILKDLLIQFYSQSKVLGSYQILGLNKPKVLIKASIHGLNIPKTLITNSFIELQSFFEINKRKIICKALYEGIFDFPRNQNYGFKEGTTLIENINAFKKDFATTLFQEYIEKEYEIRIVFLNNILYSMCIFSQNNTKTMIDFRNYDEKKPNRMIPYILDESVAQKIRNLMADIGLNMGSIDLIKARNGKFYFLEINPVGQYDFVSYHCNYHIHREIAKFLTNEK